MLLRLSSLTFLILLCCSTLASERSDYKIEVISEGLDFPWSVAFLPDSSLLVTELGGNLRKIDSNQTLSEPLEGVPAVYRAGQGGLFDVAPHPNFKENNFIYLSYASGDEHANSTTISKATLVQNVLTNAKEIYRASPSKYAALHYGGRLAWLPDNTLLLTTGDGFDFREKAQDRGTHFGKTIRIDENGKAPPDNPFVDYPYVWTYGHRNPQGLAVSASGDVYQHEHGPRGGDEINMLKAGLNYGWPAITYGIDYNGAHVSPFTELAGMVQPVHIWVPSIAPSGLAIYESDLFPGWRGSLFVGDLNNKEVKRLSTDEDGSIISEESIFTEIDARVRDIRVAPTGELFIVTDGEAGKILKVVPINR